MESELKLYAREMLYLMLADALIKKKPLPPESWSVVEFGEEVRTSGKFYEPDRRLRHTDALLTSFYYLVDFACRMPEWIDLSTANERVRLICGELADEIERITYDPERTIAEHGKLKSRLKAILAVQTCWIYREETDRRIAEMEEAKRQQLKSRPDKETSPKNSSSKWQSALAQEIFQKVCEKQKSSPQPTLF